MLFVKLSLSGRTEAIPEFYYVLLGKDRGTKIEKKEKVWFAYWKIQRSTTSKVPPKHTTQQTFVLMKTSWRRLSSLSSEDVFKTSWSRRIYLPELYVFRRRLQQVFKTSWSRPIYSFWPYFLKRSCKRLENV